MAELPEIETLRHDLEREVAGKRVKSVEVTGMRSIAHHANRKQFISHLDGVKVNHVRRKGCWLLFDLDSEEILVVDATKSGQLRRTTTREPAIDHTQVVITFTQGGQLRFIDPSEGGLRLTVTTTEHLPEVLPGLEELGVDPVGEPMSWVVFGDLLRSHDLKLKAFLTTPSILVGIGPVYSDEILWQAGLKGDRVSNKLSAQEIRRLYRAVVETMHEALKHRGVTSGPDGYFDLAGKPGGFGESLEVYERDGQACNRCRAVVGKRRIANMTSYCCPQCQV